MGFAPTFTPRYKVTYKAAGIQHVSYMRTARDTAIAAVITEGQTLYHDIFSSLATRLANDFVFLSAEVADQDTDIFDPAPVPTGVIGVVDIVTGQWSPSKRCSFISFRGRGHGARARISLFGFDINTDTSTQLGADGVVTEAEFAGISGALTSLNDHARSANGSPAIFYRNVFYKRHDKLLRKVRRGLI